MNKDSIIVVSVSSVVERDELIKRIYTNLTKEPSTTFSVRKDQINRIRVFHRVGPNHEVLIKTYLVIIVPIIIDLGPLYSLQGDITFHLDETISNLTTTIKRLTKLQGHHIVKGSGAKTLEQLVKSLGE